MKTLSTSEIVNLVKQAMISGASELLCLIGPDTDLVLLLKVLQKARNKSNTEGSGWKEKQNILDEMIKAVSSAICPAPSGIVKSLYLSQWLKLGDGLPKWDKVKVQSLALPQLGRTELELLVSLVEAGSTMVGDITEEVLLSMFRACLNPEDVIDILIDSKKNDLVRRFISSRAGIMYARHEQALLGKQIKKIISYLCREGDYDNLFVLGRHIAMFRKELLPYFASRLLRNWKDYTGKNNNSADPVYCLLGLGPKVEARIKKFLRIANVPEAKQRWESLQRVLGERHGM